jgi:excisionase family DNA binding protein
LPSPREAPLSERVLDVRGTADLFGVSEDAIYRAVQAGRLPAFRFGKRITIPGAALAKLLEDPNGSRPGEEVNATRGP